MPLIFVHGVNVRYNPKSDPFVVARDALFRRSVLARIVADPTKSLIVNPYWGDAAAKFPWNHGGLPEGRYEKFGADNPDASAVVNDLLTVGLLDKDKTDGLGGIDPDKVLLTLARSSLATAVDRLWVVAAKGLEERHGDAHAELSIAVASYVAATPHPPWLDTVGSDKEFVSMLLHHAATSRSGYCSTTGGLRH